MAVQFIGKEALLHAYEETGIETWGIFSGQKVVTSGTGVQQLETWIDCLIPAASTQRYALRLYRGTDYQDVDKSTPYSACFDFQLNEYTGSGHGASSGVLKRLEQLEQKISGPTEQDGIDINGIINDYLINPDKLVTLISGIKSLFTPGSALPVTPAPATIGAVQPGQPGPPADREEQLQRLSVALDRLEKQDPNLIAHLEKLAHIAETNKTMFGMLTKTLEGM